MSTEMSQFEIQHEVALRSEHETVVNEFSKPALARRTASIYADFGRQFDKWREYNSYPLTIPVDPRIVIAWLTDLAAEGKSPGTIGIALAAVKYAHAQLGIVFEGGSAVANAMRHIRRRNVRVQDQAAPLTRSLLFEILRQPVVTMRDMRDMALLSMAYVFALRRDELATMDYGVLANGKSVLAITDETLAVTFHWSKTAQEGGEQVVIPRDANPRASAAILRWVREGRIEHGTPLMRGLTPRGQRVTETPITGDLVGRVIRQRVHEHYLMMGDSIEDATKKAEKFSGHSGRVGFVVSATEAGVPPENIAKITRHRPGSAMVRRYGSAADQVKTSPHKEAGVGL